MSATAEKIIEATHKADPTAELIDQFAELHNFLAPYLDKYEELKKQVTAVVKADNSDGPLILSGIHYAVDYSAPSQSLKCTVTPKDLIAKTKAWGALTVSVTEARKVLSEKQVKEYFVTERGSRKLRRVRPLG